MQIQDDSEIQPPLPGPDVADIARPFLVGPIRRDVTIQQVRRNIERVVAVRRRFEFPRSFNDNPVLTHQPSNPAMPNIDTDLLQLFGHSWPAIAAKAQARLLLDKSNPWWST